jgi:hypothetical protein
MLNQYNLCAMRSAFVLGLVLTSLGCNRDRPAEPPAPPAHAPLPPAHPPDRPAGLRAQPAVEPGPADACVLFSEVALRVLASLEPSVRVQQEHSDLAGLTSCRYHWRKPNSAAIVSRNHARTRSDPRMLALLNSHRAPSDEPVERTEGELRVGVYPLRSGTESMLRQGFATAHYGESIVSAVGDQSAWDGRRMLLTARKGNRTIEVLARTSEDEEECLALATRVARDIIGRLP